MSTTTPSTERASHHLEQFIHAYNEEIERVEILESDNEELQEQVTHLSSLNNLLSNLLDDYKKGNNSLALEQKSLIDDLNSQILVLNEELTKQSRLHNENLQKSLQDNSDLHAMNAQLEKKIIHQEHLLLLAEQNSNQIISIQNGYEESKGKIKELEKQIKSFKGDGDPKRLKKNNVAYKKKIAELQSSIESMRALNVKYGYKIKELENTIVEAEKNKHHGIADNFAFSDGQHHLYRWSDENFIEQMDGSVAKRKVVLYMHETGRGSLMTIDDETGKAGMFKAPRSGLRPNKSIQDEATKILTE